MQLIHLDEVKKLISDIDKYYADNHWVIRWLKRDIESIDTIDPIAIIDKMIDKIDCYIHASKRDNISEWTLGYEMQKAVLGELKSRLSLTK